VTVVVVVVVTVSVVVAIGVSVVSVGMVVGSSTTAGASVVEVSVVVVSSYLVQPVRSAVPNATARTRVRNFFISLSPSRYWRTSILRSALGICGKKRAHDIPTLRSVKRAGPELWASWITVRARP
jgi:hypothetical protein